MAFNVGISITVNSSGGRKIANVTASLNKLDKVAKKASKSFGLLKSAIGFVAIGALFQLSKSIVKTIGSLQLMFIRLTNVEGSAAKAKVTFDKLFKTFGSSPFSIDAVADSLVRLRSAGVEAGLAIRAIEFGADAIAAFGGTSEELKRFSIGLQQVAGKGVLSMEELRQQIGEALPVAMRVFAVETGRSISEVISLVEKGKISSGEFIEQLTNGLEKDFGGFAKGLGDTVLGSIQGAFSKIKEALFQFSNSNTDVAARLAATFQNIGIAVADFIKNLTQEDVTRFFKALATGVEVAFGVGQAIIALSKILLRFVAFLSDFSGIASAATIGTLGIIGFMIFGPLGAAAGVAAGLLLTLGLMDKVKGKHKEIKGQGRKGSLKEVLRQERFEEEDDFFVPAAKVEKAATAFEKLTAGIIATDAQTKKLQDNLKAMQDRTRNARDAIEGLNKTSIAGARELGDFGKRIDASLKGAATFPFIKLAETNFNRLAKIKEKFEGDEKRLKALRAKTDRSSQEENQLKALTKELGQLGVEAEQVKIKIIQLKKIGFDKAFEKARDDSGRVLANFTKLVNEGTKYDAINEKIVEDYRAIKEELLKRLGVQEALLKSGKGQTNDVEKLKEALDKIPGAKQRALNITEKQKKLDEQILLINQNINKMEAQKTITDLKRSTRGALEIFTGSQFGDDSADRRLELSTEIERSKERILQIDKQIEAGGLTKKQVVDLEAKREVLGKIKTEQIAAFEATSAAGMLAQQLWQSVADTITGSVKESIFGLIKGTQTFEKTMNKAFDSMLQSSINFLVELVKVQLQLAVNNALQSSSSSGGGGDFFSTAAQFASTFFGGAANGAAVSGGITPFAKGGIVNGPTMFGMAGEAGTEAILPLARVGGKLGVASSGGAGGDEYHITVQAIDTQSGTEFIRKNASVIINSMRQANGLNRGIGNVR